MNTSPDIDEKKNGSEGESASKTENEAVSFNEDSSIDEEYYEKRAKKRRRRKIIITTAVLAAVVIGVLALILSSSGGKDDESDKYIDAPVERRTISNTITGSSSIEPNDSYNVTSIKSGDITADYITEGAKVKKGDKLYQFDDEDAQNQLKSAQNNLTKAQQQYEDAVKTRTQTISSNNTQTQSAKNAVEKAQNALNDARDALEDRYVSSDAYGKVSEVYANDGDMVQNGAKLADIYDDSVMKIRLPFNDFDAENIYEGASAEVSIAGTDDTAMGTVKEVASSSTATDAHTVVVYATIELANPGALTPSDLGSAVVNGAACSDTANFEYGETHTITASTSGTLRNFNLEKGDSVYGGEQVAFIESDELQSAYDNAKLSYDDAVLSLNRQNLSNDTFSQDSAVKTAQLSLDDAKTQLQTAKDTVEDFVVEAPIDGTVVTKNAKAGDTVDPSNNTEPLCVIYDLSSLKFSLDVDETEVALVKTGQKVTVTADAAEGEFVGEVIKVPVDGVNQNGVTTYTIDVEIKDYGDLLPGMNVDAEIVVEESENALAVPMNSVNRGNIVFVRDDGTSRANDVTDLMKKETDEEDTDNKKDKKNKNESPSPSPAGRPDGFMPLQSAPPNGGKSDEEIPTNIEVPEGYRAIRIETGLNDSDYIEVKSGLKDGDTVRTLNTLALSEGALDDDMEAAMSSAMGGGPGGGSGGGPDGGPGGGPRGGSGGGPR